MTQIWLQNDSYSPGVRKFSSLFDTFEIVFDSFENAHMWWQHYDCKINNNGPGVSPFAWHILTSNQNLPYQQLSICVNIFKIMHSNTRSATHLEPCTFCSAFLCTFWALLHWFVYWPTISAKHEKSMRFPQVAPSLPESPHVQHVTECNSSGTWQFL